MTAPRKAPKKVKITVSPEIRKKIEELTLFDNIFMGVAFDGQKKMTELLLREVMRKPDLVVISTRCERSFSNIGGRSIRLDVFAKDAKGKYYNIEIQREEAGADVRRMRFHASLITSKLLAAGKDFKDLPEVCVIFICETDIFKKGLPLYEISRYNYHTGEPLNDGEQIIVVNGEIQDDTPLGTIMHDLHCSDASKIKNKVIRERVRELKESDVEVEKMGGVIEEYAREREREYAKNQARDLIRRSIRLGSLTMEQIAGIFTEFTLDEIRQIEAEEMALA